MPLPVQPHEVEMLCSWALNVQPALPMDRAQGIFSIAQTGEILTVRAPCDGEDWMRLNQREDEQRWGLLKATIEVLAASKTTPDRMMLEQF
jgi:hypothetical protein